MGVDHYHRYSNESERANQDIYNDFKLKNPLVSTVCTKTIQRLNPLCPRDALKHHFTSLKDLITYN